MQPERLLRLPEATPRLRIAEIEIDPRAAQLCGAAAADWYCAGAVSALATESLVEAQAASGIEAAASSINTEGFTVFSFVAQCGPAEAGPTRR